MRPRLTTPAEHEQTLRVLCRLLDPVLGRPLPADVPRDWTAIVALASRQGVSPSLGWALQGRTLGGDIDDYAKGMLTLNRLRTDAFRSALPSVLTALDAVGARPILLKGGAALVDGLYPAPEARLLGDLDILVPRARFEAALAALTGLGYRPKPGAPPVAVTLAHERRGTYHVQAHSHPETGIGVELHWRIFGHLDDRIIPVETCLARCETGVTGELRYRVLHPTDRVIHNIAHSQIHHHGHDLRTIDLRQLFELVLLDRRDGARIDWAAIEATFTTAGHGAVLRAQAVLLWDLFGWVLPLPGLDTARLRSDPQLWRGGSRVRKAWVIARRYGGLVRAHPDLTGLLLLPTLDAVGRNLLAALLGRTAERAVRAFRRYVATRFGGRAD